MTIEQQIDCGEQLIEVLGLHLKRNGRVNTTWGDKTPLGLFLTVKRIIDDASAGKEPTFEIVPVDPITLEPLD